MKNNTLCEKYELRRGKKRCPIMKKEYPLAHAKLHVQGDRNSFIGNILAKNYATSALPIKKVAAKATIA